MALNPCDEIIPEDPPTSGDDDETGLGGEADDGTQEEEDTPEATEEQPEVPLPPFPLPFVPQVEPEVEGPAVPPILPIPPRPPFLSAMREVTTVSDNLFVTEGVDLAGVRAELELDKPERDRGRRAAAIGALWFRNRVESMPTADLFRWAIYAVWNSDNNSEYFFRKFCGPHSDIHANAGLNMASPFETSPQYRDLDSSRIIDLYHGGAQAQERPRRYDRVLVQEEEEITVKEKIRLTLKVKERRLSNESFAQPATEIKSFINTFVPNAIAKAQITHQQKIAGFLNIYLFGDRGEDWSIFESLEPPASTAEYYRQGVLQYGVKYHDYVFDAPVAFFEEEANNMLLTPFHSAKITKKIGNVDYVNVKGYENELQVPNVYHYYNSMEIEKKYKNRFESGEIGHALSEFLAAKRIRDAYSSVSKDPSPYSTPRVLKFPSDRVEKLDSINEVMKGYAENYVEISINTSQKGTINAMLQRNKLDRLLMEVIEPIDAPNIPAIFGNVGGYPLSDNLNRPTDINTKITTNTTAVLDDAFTEIQGEQNSIARTENDRTVSGIASVIRDSFFEILKKHLPESDNRGFQAVDLNEYPLYYTGWENADLLRLEEAIKSQIFVTQAEKFIAENKLQRSYADILNGQKAYSETVGYRVEKHLLNENDGEELIQTFLLMDSNEIDKINFIDSQVMPFKRYKYKIFTINLVIGTEYEYSESDTEIDAPLIDLAINSKKKVYIVNSPFFEQVVETRDMPPMSPQVNFLPYQGVDDKVGILLTTDYGEIKEPWLLHKPPYSEELTDFLKGKYGMDKDNMIKWKTDSMPDAFDVFRLERPPESYEWFHSADSSRYVGSKRGPRKFRRIPSYGKVAFFLDDIEPNKYYYYMFRAVDNYDFENPDQSEDSKTMRSNPTEVFRVRMVSYVNGIFMEMEPYEMYKKPTEARMNFERLLKISPSFDQTLVDFSNSFRRIATDVTLTQNSITSLRKDLELIKGKQYIADTNEFQKTAPPVEELSLGVKDQQEHKIWGKKFKFRLKSKATGKMIDLNILFSQRKKTKPE